MGEGELPFQRHHRRNRQGGRIAHRRRQSAPRSGRAQRAHPQPLAPTPKRWRTGAFPIGLIGERADLTYRYDYLGAGPQTLADVAAGAHEFASVLKKAERPVVIVGMSALARPDGAAIASLAARAAQAGGGDGWNGFSVLHTAAAR